MFWPGFLLSTQFFFKSFYIYIYISNLIHYQISEQEGASRGYVLL